MSSGIFGTGWEQPTLLLNRLMQEEVVNDITIWELDRCTTSHHFKLSTASRVFSCDHKIAQGNKTLLLITALCQITTEIWAPCTSFTDIAVFRRDTFCSLVLYFTYPVGVCRLRRLRRWWRGQAGGFESPRVSITVWISVSRLFTGASTGQSVVIDTRDMTCAFTASRPMHKCLLKRDHTARECQSYTYVAVQKDHAQENLS